MESWKENSQIKPLNVKSSPLEGNQPAAIYLQTLDKFKYFQIKLMFYVLSVSYNQTIFNLNCILFQLKGQVTKITRIITCAVGYGASDNTFIQNKHGRCQKSWIHVQKYLQYYEYINIIL